MITILSQIITSISIKLHRVYKCQLANMNWTLNYRSINCITQDGRHTWMNTQVVKSEVVDTKLQSIVIFANNSPNQFNFWPDCKAIPAYGLMMSVCPSVRLSVRPSVCLSVNIWLTSVFKFVIGHINQYRLYTLHGNRPWWDLLNCDLSLWPWPWLFLFKVT